MAKLRWGILSTGNIAGSFAEALKTAEYGTLTAVASRTEKSAEAFARKHGIAEAFGSYEALLASPSIDAVYIGTPHPFHKEWIQRAAESGKHILCEKPLTMNHAEAEEAFAAAQKAGVFLMEAFMYRAHPQTAKVAEIIRQNTIGQVCAFQSSFCGRRRFDPESRLFKAELGGGAILDLGCYPLSYARLIAGAAEGSDFADPCEIKAVGSRNSQTGVDEHTSALLHYDSGFTAEISCSLVINRPSTTVIYGTMGSLVIEDPWFAGRQGKWQFSVQYPNEKPQVISGKTSKNLYAHQADVLAQYCATGQAPSPAMSREDTLGNMKALDQWAACLR